MEIDEKIHIEEHNPEWFKQYEYEKKQLCETQVKLRGNMN